MTLMRKLGQSVAVMVSCTVVILAILASVGAYIQEVAGEQLATGIRVVVVAATITGVLTLAVLLLTVGGVAWFRILTQRESLLKSRAERKAAERDAEVTVITAPRNYQVHVRELNPLATWQARHLDVRAIANSFQEITPFDVAVWQEWHKPKTISSPIHSVFADVASRPLLPALDGCENILVVGAKGTGKTSLLQHLEAQRTHNSQIIVLDSHAQPAQWQGHVVGLGRAYQNIKRTMIALNHRLNKRYQEWAKGKTNFQPIHTFIDEFTLLPKVLKGIGYDIQAYSVPALTEGRKVNIHCIWGIHSDRVKAMGLEGAGDLKECFDAVVYLKQVKGEYYALVDFGEGKEEVKYLHPGPFIIEHDSDPPAEPFQVRADSKPDQETPISVPWKDMEWVVAEDQTQEATKPAHTPSGPDEAYKQRVIELFESGKTITAICVQIHGYKNKKRLDAIRQILVEAGKIG